MDKTATLILTTKSAYLRVNFRYTLTTECTFYPAIVYLTVGLYIKYGA